MSDLIVCGNTEVAGDLNRRWAHKDVTWRFDGNLQGLPIDATIELMDVAAQLFNSKCGIRLRQWQQGDPLNIRIVTTRLDGPLGVLADMELPHILDPSTKRMRLDISDRFVIADNPQTPRISLRHVFEHELGHGLGLPHGGTGRMAARYNLTDPLDAWTIAGLFERYGPPSDTPPPPPINPDLEDILWSGENFEIVMRKKT